MAWIAGVGSGVALSGAIFGNIIDYAIRPLAKPWNWTDLFSVFNSFIIAIGTISTLAYFTFTLTIKKPLQTAMKIGRYFLMFSFGTTVGAAVFSNSAFLYERVQYLLLTPYAWIPLPIAALLILIDIMLRKKKNTKEL
jgi:hypothetical protein